MSQPKHINETQCVHGIWSCNVCSKCADLNPARPSCLHVKPIIAGENIVCWDCGVTIAKAIPAPDFTPQAQIKPAQEADCVNCGNTKDQHFYGKFCYKQSARILPDAKEFGAPEPIQPSECPMCGPDCVGGAHANALREDGITTRVQFEALRNEDKTRSECEFELPPLDEGAIAHMEGEDHNFGSAYRCREEQLLAALARAEKAESAIDSWKKEELCWREINNDLTAELTTLRQQLKDKQDEFNRGVEAAAEFAETDDFPLDIELWGGTKKAFGTSLCLEISKGIRALKEPK